MQKIVKILFIVTVILPLSTFAWPGMRKQEQIPLRQLQICQDDEIVVNGQCQTNDLDKEIMSSKAVLLESAGLQLEWGFPENQTGVAHFYMQINSNNWFGIGFGQNMGDADIIMAEVNGDQVILTDCNVDGYRAPSSDSSQDVTLLGYRVTGSKVEVKFSRNLNTGDSNDQVLVKGQQTWVQAAYSPSSTVQQHAGDQRNVIQVLFDENVNVVAEEPEFSTTYKAHTLGLLIMWGFATDIAISVVRHLKTWRWYMWFHGGLFFCIDLYTFATVFKQLDDNIDNLDKIESKTVKGHYISGVTFVSILFIQHFVGAAIKLFAEDKKGRKDWLQKLTQLHRYSGYFMYLFGKVMLITGAYSNYLNRGKDQKYFAQGFIFIGIGFAIQFISIAVHQAQKNSEKKYVAVNQEQELTEKLDQDLANLVQKGLSASEIQTQLQKPNLMYCLYGNRIVNISSFMHPGGNYILSSINGRDIDRCFFGGYALEGDKRPAYTHSKAAEKYLINNTVGFLKFPDAQNVLTKFSGLNAQWSINNNTQTTPTTKTIYFKSAEHQMKNYVQGINWIGRYFQVKKVNKEKRRLYTTVQCLTKDNIEYRKQLVEYALNGFEGQAPQKMTENSEELPLIIKKYGKFDQTLSSVIHEGVGENFQIQGPNGVGLGLSEKSNGTYVLISGGTGILPLLDLLNIFLQKQIYEIAKEKKGEEFAKANIDIHNIGLGENLNYFKIYLYSAFIEESEFLGRDIIEPLCQLQNKYELNTFDFCAKFQKKAEITDIKTTSSRFNQKFFDSENSRWGEKLQKVFLCGPPGMSAAVPPALNNILGKDKIHFV